MSELTRREWLQAGAMSLGAFTLAPSASASTRSAERSFHYDHICGTSLDVWYTAPDTTDAETRILAEVERLTSIFSLYDSNSELSRFNRSVGRIAVSDNFATVLQQYEIWQARTGGACNPLVGAFVKIWAEAEREQQLPDDRQLAALAARIQRPGFVLNGTLAAKSGEWPLNLNAIAKGFIVDRLAKVMKSVAGITSGLVNLGGDMATFGDSYSIGIQDPHRPADNAQPLGLLNLQNQSVATSGGYQRFYTIRGQKHSHLIDPRTGHTASAVASATVLAPNSITANGLATTLGVMGIAEGLRLVASVPGAQCLLVGPDGRRHLSEGFPLKPQLAFADTPKGAWPEGFQVNVALELPALNVGKYRRPYVAVWIEDADGKPVRTLQVWGNSPKYTKDLSDWWKFAKSDAALVKASTRATRGPGKYSLVWDGKDDAGKALPQGTYTVKIEVHREHGKHLRQSGKIECGTEKAEVKLAKNDETGETVVSYGAKK